MNIRKLQFLIIKICFDKKDSEKSGRTFKKVVTNAKFMIIFKKDYVLLYF